MNKKIKCDKCQFRKRYRTGADEYPACTTIEYCSKGHWEGGDIPSAEDIDNWSNCADFCLAHNGYVYGTLLTQNLI